ncbi:MULTISPECIES: D-alanyl-D-alanine carboxypeptidase family protein [unclassified Novosphingobium]|uniref:D-alanyl-D-alanine carboxypeptidase family protein n=1 Tax=unclassified Novosphingobium TaxID=2644732 RepID=UPI0025DB6F61|nr:MULTISPECIES: D-alanyl-D-alanine carboxypeptidase family protein [unclassified Novosphingobium]HQS69186.1 D-alanyl-D-alanine carboxypeptidase family protein [Novosphingobium sp.]
MTVLAVVAAGFAPVNAAAPVAAGSVAGVDMAMAAMPQIDAPIALLVDVGSGRVLYARDVHRRFVPASITKIMTSYVAFDLITKGKLRLDQRMPMRPETFKQWHRVGSTMFLPADSQASVAELIEGIVTVSANDACVVLAEGAVGSVPAFTKLMNDAAAELGMRDSHFNTPNGWMDEGQTYVTAADLATLSGALMTRFPELYRQFYGHAGMTWGGISQPNHNPLYGYVEGADGVKTGFTNEAGYGFVGSAQRNGRRLVMVLGGYDRPNLRAKQSRELIEWGFAMWDAQPLFAKGAEVGSAVVQGGAAREVPLLAPRDLSVTVPRGAKAAYSLSVRYKGPLKAPIAKGETVGSLLVRVPGEAVHVLPLVAGADVAKGGMLDRLRDGALGLVGL